MNRSRLAILIAVILSRSAVSAAPGGRGQISFIHLGSEQGLSQGTVRCIFQDRAGFLWFGTQDGLNRYDGNTFVIYRHNPEDPRSLPNNSVSSILEDSRGELWVGTSGGGVSVMDRNTEQFATFRHGGDASSISDDSVTFLHEDRAHKLWIGTEFGGLNVFDLQRRQFTHYRHKESDPDSLAADDVRAMVEDASGTAWFGTRSAGLDRFDGGTQRFRHFRHDAHDPQSLLDDSVISLAAAAGGRLWIGTLTGLDSLDGASFRFSHPEKDARTDSISAIRALASGEVWAGTHNGLRMLNGDGESARYLHQSQNAASLCSDRITSIFEDRSGILWFGTDRGVDRVIPERERFTAYGGTTIPFRDGGDTSVWSFLVQPNQVLWLGLVNGLGRFNRTSGEFKRFESQTNGAAGPGPNSAYSLAEDGQGSIWAGGTNGLTRFDPTTGQFVVYRHDPSRPKSLGSNVIYAVHRDPSGALWLGMQNGLDRFDPHSGESVHYRHDAAQPDSLGDNEIRAIAADPTGNLWIGTRHGGLDLFDPSTGKFRHFVHDPAKPDSLSVNAVYAVLCGQKGIVWVGTPQGLNRLDPKTGTFQHFTEKNGLPNDTIYGILQAANGDVWISTDKGLSRMSAASGVFRNYNAGDGLPGNEFNGGVAYQSASGEMFFGGPNGFSSFYPEQVRDSSYQPPVVITRFKKLDRQVPGISGAKSIDVSYKDYVFSIEFAALDYSAPEKCRYAYKLEGLDGDWRYSGTGREAFYTNLDGGHYTFRVKGTNADGVWSPQEAALSIDVLPPPWRRRWFLAMAAMLLLANLGWAYHRRIAQFRRANAARETFAKRLIESQEAERKRIAGELHDGLGQNLMVIKNFALLGLKDDSQSHKRLDEISATASLALEEVRQIAYNLRPYQLDRLGLTKALKSLVNQARNSSSISFTSEIDPLDDLFSSKDDQINLYRVVQESVNNILKHSGATEAHVGIAQEEDCIRVRVEDNGRGFDAQHPGQTERGFGISGMSERARILGARLTVRSTPSGGTAIQLEIPLKEERL